VPCGRVETAFTRCSSHRFRLVGLPGPDGPGTGLL
jgi:hypothetical protein